MIKRLIEQFYQTMFNYFVKKDGYSSITHYLASMMIMLICIFFVADAFAIANIIRPRFIGFSTAPKGKVFLVLIIMSILNYLFLFQILRLEKEGDQDKHLFVINEVQYKKTLKAIWFIFISFFVLVDIPTKVHQCSALKYPIYSGAKYASQTSQYHH